MGAGKSKSFPLSFEEAQQRVSQTTIDRLRETFRRLSTSSGYLPQATFIRDVLGETVPAKLAEAIYSAFGGGSKGMVYRDLVCGLGLLVHGTPQEKAKFVTLLVSEDGVSVVREHIEAMILSCDGHPPLTDLSELFGDTENNSCLVDDFEGWILKHPDLASFTEWLLGEGTCKHGLKLEAEPDPPTFYQNLSERYQMSEKDIMDIEKTYWGLKGGSGKLDKEVFRPYVSPPVPDDLVDDLYRAVDINRDGHIDLAEMIQLIAVCCKRTPIEGHKFCFRVFDSDEDGLLSREELARATQMLHTIKVENADDATVEVKGEVRSELAAEEEEGRRVHEAQTEDDSPHGVALLALRSFSNEHEGHMTEEEYVQWSSSVPHLSTKLLSVLFEVCHVRFGLRPQTLADEAKVIRGYMRRFKRAGRCHGNVVYLITASWFQHWKAHTGYENGVLKNGPTLMHKKSKRKRKKGKGSGQQNALTTLPPTSQLNGHPEQGEEPIEILNIAEVGGSPLATGGVEFCAGQEYQSDSKVPAIDNSELCAPESSASKKLPSLTNEGGHILKTKVLIENVHYILLPEVVWKILVTWYGNSGYAPLALPRMIRGDGEVELYPISFKIYRHTTVPPPAKQSTLPWPLPVILCSLGVMTSATPPPVTAAPLLAGSGEGAQPVIPRRVLYYQATFNKSTTMKEVIDRMCQVLHTKAEDIRIHDFTDEEHPQLLDDEDKTIVDLGFTDSHKLLIETRNRDNSWPEEIIAVMRELQTKDPTPAAPPIHEGRVTPGATGLSNLGNTCFMNSALQCISNAQPLTRYFLEKDHLLEINKDNPLGMGGVMAKRYSDLIGDLWSGNSKSITPLKFRFTVGRCAPQFNGFQQQDAQELLAFVLDGLHEDLNRVKEKAYKELNDSDGRPDDVVASEAWNYHLSRNQSVIVDLFHGQLKSVVTCKMCGYASVRFDPFTFLSLPLPYDSTFNLEVVVLRLDGSQPVRYGIKLELDDKYRHLKEVISELSGIPLANLRLAEVYGAMVKSLPADSTKIRSVLGGFLYAFEIPPPPPVRPTSRSDSPDEVQRQLKKIKIERERTLSLKGAQVERIKAQRAREKVARMQQSMEREDETVAEEKEEADDSDEHDGLAQISDGEEDRRPTVECVSVLPAEAAGMEESDGFVFAVHRRTYSIEHYFTQHQKMRLMLFGIPLVVPCVASSTGSQLYDTVWSQVKRLIIPDPPTFAQSQHSTEDVQKEMADVQQFPFELKKVNKDSVSCSQCPWYRFCRGCPIVCNENAIGKTSGYIALDWDLTTLQLKYQSALERPVDHESMESLKIIDTKPIDLYECFKAFVREDELGDEESWYCKECKKHQEATKSLEIWRLPPILIIHLKRFQFFNGRWVKSQRSVTFPTENLEPLRYTVENGNGGQARNARTDKTKTGHQPMHIEDRENKQPSLKRPLTPPINVTSGPPTKRFGTDKEVEGQIGGQSDDIETMDISGAENVECTDKAGEDDSSGGVGEVDNDVIVPGIDSGSGGIECEQAKPPSEPAVDLSESNDRLPSNMPKIYDLFATCCHSGVMGGGHYISFAKNANGKWHYYNDSACKETTEERIFQESPYMLFYQLQGLEQYFDKFRAPKHGKRQEFGSTDDDREFEETLKSLRKACLIQ